MAVTEVLCVGHTNIRGCLVSGIPKVLYRLHEEGMPCSESLVLGDHLFLHRSILCRGLNKFIVLNTESHSEM